MRMPDLNAVDQPRLRQIALIVDVAAKVALVALLVIAAAYPAALNVAKNSSAPGNF